MEGRERKQLSSEMLSEKKEPVDGSVSPSKLPFGWRRKESFLSKYSPPNDFAALVEQRQTSWGQGRVTREEKKEKETFGSKEEIERAEEVGENSLIM